MSPGLTLVLALPDTDAGLVLVLWLLMFSFGHLAVLRKTRGSKKTTTPTNN